MLKHIQVVIFDCDGVLFDTREANRAYYNHILRHFGRPVMTPEQFEFVHMHTVDAAITHLFSDTRRVESVHQFRKTLRYADFFQFMRIDPHLFALLDKLNPVCHTAIATNRSDTMAPLMTEFDLHGRFDMVVTSSDVKQPKPHPEQLERILARFGVSAREAIYVGDSRVDETAAAAAGIPLVAYDNPDLAAAWHIRDLKDLDDLLFSRRP